MSPSSTGELLGLALACGASEVGGPLTKAEAALAARALPIDKRAARLVRAAIRDGADPLGVAFCELRAPLERRALGAFFTSPALVEPMVSWALKQHPQRIVDPGCGSGRFSATAARRKRTLDIVAIDVDPIATILTRAALAAVGARRAQVIHDDYLTVRIPPIDGRSAFISNPPYVRHHDLHPATKARASSLAKKAGHTISGLAGLHALFYLATLARHGVTGDVGSFITSAEWLDVGYGSVIRSMFTNGLGGRSLAVFDAESVPFADAMTTAAITTFQIGEAVRAARFARLRRAQTAFALEELGHDVERTALIAANRWSPFLRDPVADVGGDTIGSLFRVSRGQVTGANDYFVMSRSQARERGVERFCIPVVSAAKEVFGSGGVLRNRSARMLALSIPGDLNLARHPRLAAYVRAGEASGIHQGYIARHRRPWYAVTYPRPPIVATYMARQAPVFARNADALGILNIAHGLHPRQALPVEELDHVVHVLNEARATFIGRGRTYHGGLEKFEPGEMEALPLMIQVAPEETRRGCADGAQRRNGE